MSFEQNLNEQQFFHILELDPRCDNNDLIQAAALADEIEGFSLSAPVSDKEFTLEEAQQLRQRYGKDVQVHLCGRDRDEKEVVDFLSEASAQELHTILALTGDAAAEDCPYTSSTKIINLGKRIDDEFSFSVAINPFKYEANDSFAQYFRLVQKVKSGATCIISHNAWDMKKYHEIPLYLAMREIYTPLIARLQFIKLEDLELLSEKEFDPGVQVSREFAAFVQREEQEGEEIFYKKQIRRLALQIHGCRFMGYNGVMLRGLDNAQDLERLLSYSSELEKEITTFSDWVDAWNDFHPGVQMAPKNESFYLFEKLLDPLILSRENPYSMVDTKFRLPSSIDIMQHKLCSQIKAERLPDFLQNLLLGRTIKSGEDDPSYLPIGSCPKGLIHGACGGVRAESLCEINDKVCIHSERVSLAAHFNELDTLEKPTDDE